MAYIFDNTVLKSPSLKFSSPHDTLLSGIPYRKVGLLWSHPFWKLQQAIQVDRHRPGVCLELRKQTMVYDLAALIEDRAITGEDLAEFSDEVKERVAILLQQPLGE